LPLLDKKLQLIVGSADPVLRVKVIMNQMFLQTETVSSRSQEAVGLMAQHIVTTS
jgi:hypothetical protein